MSCPRPPGNPSARSWGSRAGRRLASSSSWSGRARPARTRGACGCATSSTRRRRRRSRSWRSRSAPCPTRCSTCPTPRRGADSRSASAHGGARWSPGESDRASPRGPPARARALGVRPRLPRGCRPRPASPASRARFGGVGRGSDRRRRPVRRGRLARRLVSHPLSAGRHYDRAREDVCDARNVRALSPEPQPDVRGPGAGLLGRGRHPVPDRSRSSPAPRRRLSERHRGPRRRGTALRGLRLRLRRVPGEGPALAVTRARRTALGRSSALAATLLAACSRAQPATAPATLVPVTPLAERAARTLAVPGYADFLALEGDDAWVTNEGRVEKLTASSAAPVASVPIAEPCGAMAVDFGALWVADCRNRTLVRVDLATDRIVATIATGLADPEGELSVAAGAGSVWLLTDAAGVLSRIDPATNRVVARITVPPHSYAAVFGFGSVWISTSAASERDARSGSVERVDPVSDRVVATIPVGPNPRFLAAGAGGVWTLNQGDGTVSRVSPETNGLVATISAGVPGTGGDIVVAASRVWVRAKATALSVIDPASDSVVARFGPPHGGGAVRGNDRVVWGTAHDVHAMWVLQP